MNTLAESKLIPLKDNQICIALIQNPFDLKNVDRQVLDMDLDRDVTLSELLPVVYNDYVVSVNGVIIERSEWSTRKVSAGEYIVFCPVPEGGGGGGKDVLRMAALIGLSVFTLGGASIGGITFASMTSLAGPALYAAGIATFGVGSFLINSILPPTPPEIDSSDLDKSASYGIDGAKNTSSEGIPVPVVYGNFRVGGNLINAYTENQGVEGQYLYLLYALSEGAVSGYEESSIRINDKPISEYKDIEVRFRPGDARQIQSPDVPDTIAWFSDQIVQKQVGLTLEGTPGDYPTVSYTTSQSCNRVRVDLLFPLGFRRVSDDGTAKPWEIELEATIDGEVFPDIGGYSGYSNEVPKQYVYNYSESASHGDITRPENYSVYDSIVIGTTEIDGVLYKDVQVREAGFDSPQTVTREVGYVTQDPAQIPHEQTWRIYGKHVNPYRVSFTSPELDFGVHTITIKRTEPSSEGPTEFDKVIFSECAEIVTDPVEYRNTAILALKIKVDDQLSGVPSMSVVVHGKLCDVNWYYLDTDVVANTVASSNPAVIAMDMMTNKRYGAGIDIDRINIAAFDAWRRYCDFKSLEFHGVFDTNMTVWDALRHVFRIGRAQLINVGTVFSVAMEAPGEPVMMFNVANITQNSFKTHWLPLQDRANEIEVSYFDRENYHKQTTLRLSDSLTPATTSQRTASVTLYGCTDKDQAIAEAELLLRMNRYILQTVTFDTPVEAIACTVGDLIYVQHDVPQWAYGGRLEANSTDTLLKLDRSVPTGGGPFKALLHLDSMTRGQSTVTDMPSPRYLVLDSIPLGRYRKVVYGGEEYTIESIVQGDLVVKGVIVDRTFDPGVGVTVDLVDIDLIEEFDVASISPDGREVTLATSVSFIPPQFTKWMFGPTDKAKKPFRVTSISGGNDFTRTITALEYHESVYGETGDFVPPINLSSLGLIQHVRDLAYSVETITQGTQSLPLINLNWRVPSDGAYAGADIYMREENDVYTLVGETRHGVTSFEYRSGIFGQRVQFKVQAVDALGRKADFNTAPETDIIDLGEFTVTAPAVTNMWVDEVTNFPQTVTEIYSTLYVNVTPPDALQDPESLFNHARIEYRLINTPDWSVLGNTIDKLPLQVLRTGDTYVFRAYSVDVNGNVSTEFVEVQHTVTTASVVLAPTVDRLRLINGANGDDHIFTGNTIQVEWDEPSNADWHEVGNASNTTHSTEFDKYEIQVWSADNTTRLGEIKYRNDPSFVYTYTENTSDYLATYGSAGASRQVIIKVWVLGKNLQRSGQPAELEVLNPPPIIEGMSISGGYNELVFSYSKIIDSDFQGIKFYVDDTDPNFTPDDGTNLELTLGSSPQSPSYISSYRGTPEGIEGGKIYYVKWKMSDDFGDTESSHSIAAATHMSVTDRFGTLAPWAFQVDPADRDWITERLQDDAISNAKIESITAAKITTGILHATYAINSDGLISVSDAVYGADVMTADPNNPVTPAVHEVVLGPREFNLDEGGGSVDPRTAFFSFTQNNIPLVAFYTDGEAVFSGKVIVSDTSNVEPGATVGADWTTNIKNLPLTIQAFQDAFVAQGDGQVVTFWALTAPVANDPGDFWIDTDDNSRWTWSGSAWVDASDDGVLAAIIAATDDPAKADGQVVTYLSEDDPDDTINPVEGDLWFQPSTQLLSRYDFNTLAWESASGNFFLTSGFLDDALLKQPHWDFIREKPDWITDFDAAVLEQLDGNIVAVYQDDEPDPANYSQGDLWYDTDGDIWYRHNNGIWEITVRNAIIQALEKAYAAEAVANDGLINTYLTTETPTLLTYTLEVGDLWYNPDTQRIHRFDGVDWQPFSVTKTSMLEDDAILGETAKWYNLDNMPSRYSDTATPGVNITSEHIGIFKDGAWHVYMNDQGQFFLNDGDPDHFIAWDGQTLAIRGEVRATDIKAESTIVGSTWKTSDFAERIEVNHDLDGISFYDEKNKRVIYMGRDDGEQANIIIDKTHLSGIEHGIKLKTNGYGMSISSGYYGLGVTSFSQSYPSIIGTGNANVGVYGHSYANGATGVGVFGHASGSNSVGVKGTSSDTSDGIGVYGESFCGVYGKATTTSLGPQPFITLPDPVVNDTNPDNLQPLNSPEDVVQPHNPTSYHRLTETKGSKVKDSVGSKDMDWIGIGIFNNAPIPRSTDILGDGDKVVTGQLDGLGGVKISAERLIDDPYDNWTFNCLVVLTDNTQTQVLMCQWTDTVIEIRISLVNGVITVEQTGELVYNGGLVDTGQLRMISVVREDGSYQAYINGVAV